MQLTIMTFNIHRAEGMDGKTDLGRIEAEIRKSKADVAALQEVDRYHPRSGWKDQIRLLARGLGMHQAFAPSVNFGLVQYGNAILSRYPVMSKQVVYFQGMSERRSVLAVKLQTEAGNLTVVNTHLGVMERERVRQMPRLLEVLQETSRPAILLGDFNMGANHGLMQTLQVHWRKAVLTKKYPTLAYGGEIDHIFTDIPGVIATADVQQTSASDHHAVVARLAWP